MASSSNYYPRSSASASASSAVVTTTSSSSSLSLTSSRSPSSSSSSSTLFPPYYSSVFMPSALSSSSSASSASNAVSVPSLSTPKFSNMPSPAFRQGGRGSKQVFAALDPHPSQLHKSTSQNPSQAQCVFTSTNVASSSSGSSNSHLYVCSNNNAFNLNHSNALSGQSLMLGSEGVDLFRGVDDRKYVLFNGRQSPCFARVVKQDHEGKDSILLQPLRPSFMHSNLLIPWEGHLWSAKRTKTIEVKMKLHPTGELEVISNEKVEEFLARKSANQRFVYPVNQSSGSGIAALDDNCDVISLESSEYDDTSNMDFSLFPQHTHGSNLNHRSSSVGNTSLITKRLLTDSVPCTAKPFLGNSPQSLPKPSPSITSTPGRTASSIEALQKIKSSSAIKLPLTLVSTSKGKLKANHSTPSSVTSDEPCSQIDNQNILGSTIAPHDLVTIGPISVTTPQANEDIIDTAQEELAKFAEFSSFVGNELSYSMTSHLDDQLISDRSLTRPSSDCLSTPSIFISKDTRDPAEATESALVTPKEPIAALLTCSTPNNGDLPNAALDSPHLSFSFPQFSETPTAIEEEEAVSSNQLLSNDESSVNPNTPGIAISDFASNHANEYGSEEVGLIDQHLPLDDDLNNHPNNSKEELVEPRLLIISEDDEVEEVEEATIALVAAQEIGDTDNCIADDQELGDVIMTSSTSGVESREVVTSAEDASYFCDEMLIASSEQTVPDQPLIPQSTIVVEEYSPHKASDVDEEPNNTQFSMNDPKEKTHLQEVVTQFVAQKEDAEDIPVDELVGDDNKDHVEVVKPPLHPKSKKRKGREVTSGVDISSVLLYSKRSVHAAVAPVVEHVEDILIDNDDHKDHVEVVKPPLHPKSKKRKGREVTSGVDISSVLLYSKRSVHEAVAPVVELVEDILIDNDDHKDHVKVVKPPLHPESKKRKGREAASDSVISHSIRSAQVKPELPNRRSRQSATVSLNKRDSIFGSFPTRKQSAASGDWRI